MHHAILKKFIGHVVKFRKLLCVIEPEVQVPLYLAKHPIDNLVYHHSP